MSYPASKQQPANHLWGIDFTSAPTRQKPIVAVKGSLLPCEKIINVDHIYQCTTFAEFEAFLHTPPTQPQMVAVDIPLGLPADFLKAINWPSDSWEQYLKHISSLNKSAYRHSIRTYQAQQPKGAKEPKRPCDSIAGALSPTKLHYIPTANMLYEGATRIAHQTHISVWPCRYQSKSNFQLVEGYPALVMKTLSPINNNADATGYKHENKQTNSSEAKRQQLLALMASPIASTMYGGKLSLTESQQQAVIADYKGDVIDALACLLQACWAANNLSKLIMPNKIIEGWIVDPKTLTYTVGY